MPPDKPVARPLASGVILPRRRPVLDVHVVITRVEPGSFRYEARSRNNTWSANVSTDWARVALFDVITNVVGTVGPGFTVRLVPRLPPPVFTAAHETELHAHFPSLFIAYATATDRPILDSMESDLTARLRSEAMRRPAIVAATDGSVKGDALGVAWLSETGSHGSKSLVAHDGHTDHWTLVLAAELRAVAAVVEAYPHRRLSLLVDSRAAISILRRWQSGHHVPTSTIGRVVERSTTLTALRLRLAEAPTLLDVAWSPGHRGDPLNEGADALAHLARRCAKHAPITESERRRRAADLAQAFADEHRSTSHPVAG